MINKIVTLQTTREFIFEQIKEAQKRIDELDVESKQYLTIGAHAYVHTITDKILKLRQEIITYKTVLRFIQGTQAKEE